MAASAGHFKIFGIRSYTKCKIWYPVQFIAHPEKSKFIIGIIKCIKNIIKF